jgi:hypothetical protein
MLKPIEVFFSYAHEDEGLMNEVRRQLAIHERPGYIIKWHDRQIPPGDEWKGQIDERLNRAEINSTAPKIEISKNGGYEKSL